MCCLIKSSFSTEFAWRRFEINYAAVCGVTKHLEFKGCLKLMSVSLVEFCGYVLYEAILQIACLRLSLSLCDPASLGDPRGRKDADQRRAGGCRRSGGGERRRPDPCRPPHHLLTWLQGELQAQTDSWWQTFSDSRNQGSRDRSTGQAIHNSVDKGDLRKSMAFGNFKQ